MKAMVFIDGAWLYRNRSSIFRKLGEENGCEIDYAKLPRVFCEDVANYLDEDISLVRTNYFGTLPSARSSFSSSKQRAFYDFLERSCGYEMEIHEVDVGGEGGHDDMWIKMALGASLLFNAAMPGSFDIAVLIGDDLDYVPVLRRTRLFGRHIPDLEIPRQRLPAALHRRPRRRGASRARERQARVQAVRTRGGDNLGRSGLLLFGVPRQVPQQLISRGCRGTGDTPNCS